MLLSLADVTYHSPSVGVIGLPITNMTNRGTWGNIRRWVIPITFKFQNLQALEEIA